MPRIVGDAAVVSCRWRDKSIESPAPAFSKNAIKTLMEWYESDYPHRFWQSTSFNGRDLLLNVSEESSAGSRRNTKAIPLVLIDRGVVDILDLTATLAIEELNQKPFQKRIACGRFSGGDL